MIEALNQTGDNVEDREETDVVTLYTRCVLRDGVWYEWQEVDSVFVDNSELLISQEMNYLLYLLDGQQLMVKIMVEDTLNNT